MSGVTFQSIIEKQQREPPPICDDVSVQRIPARDNGEELVDINTSGSTLVRMLPAASTPFSGDLCSSAGLPHSSFIRQVVLKRLEGAVNNLRMILQRPALVFTVVEGIRLKREVEEEMYNYNKSTGGCVSFRVFDDEIDEFVDMGDLEVLTFSKNLTVEQQKNRGALLTACGYAGLINYPYEWWTFCYGTKYYCYYTGNKVAIYDEKL